MGSGQEWTGNRKSIWSGLVSGHQDPSFHSIPSTAAWHGLSLLRQFRAPCPVAIYGAWPLPLPGGHQLEPGLSSLQELALSSFALGCSPCSVPDTQSTQLCNSASDGVISAQLFLSSLIIKNSWLWSIGS